MSGRGQVMKNKLIYGAKAATIGLALFALPACEWSKKAPAASETASATAVAVADQGPWMIRVSGQPTLYKKEFDETLAAMLAQNFGGALSPDALPAQMKIQILKGFAKGKAIELEAEKLGLDQSDEFKTQMKKAMEMIRQQLLIQLMRKKMFDEQVVTEAELKTEYNKDPKKFVKAPDYGVMLAGVKFADQAKATAFMGQVKGKEAEFDKLGNAATDGKFRSFGRVKDDSVHVPETIRTAALSVKKFPTVEMVQDNNDFWVINAANKKDAEHKLFEEVKDELREIVRHNKWREDFEQREEKAIGAFNVEMNESFFKDEDARKAAEQNQFMSGAGAVNKPGAQHAIAVPPSSATVA